MREMATSPRIFVGPVVARSHTMSARMPAMIASSGENGARLLKLSRMGVVGDTAFSVLPLGSSGKERQDAVRGIAGGDLRRPGGAHHVEEIDDPAVDEREQRLRPEPEHEHDDRE